MLTVRSETKSINSSCVPEGTLHVTRLRSIQIVVVTDISGRLHNLVCLECVFSTTATAIAS